MRFASLCARLACVWLLPRRLRLLQRGAIGSVIYREQHRPFHLRRRCNSLYQCIRDARAKLNALHRFNATVKTIPLTDRLHQHLSGADCRAGGAAFCATLSSQPTSRKEHHRAERGQVNVPVFCSSLFYSGKCSRRARRSVRSRATSCPGWLKAIVDHRHKTVTISNTLSRRL